MDEEIQCRDGRRKRECVKQESVRREGEGASEVSTGGHKKFKRVNESEKRVVRR